MLHKLNVSRLFLTLCLFASLAFAAFADTIRLKDGGIIKGRIVSFNGGKFVVAVGEGPRRREMAFRKKRVLYTNSFKQEKSGHHSIADEAFFGENQVWLL